MAITHMNMNKKSITEEHVFVLGNMGEKTKSPKWWVKVLWVPVVAQIGIVVYTASDVMLRSFTVIKQLSLGHVVDINEALRLAFYIVMNILALVTLQQFISSDERSVELTDAEEKPEEALLWKWCLPCGFLVPPKASHCNWCERCVHNRFFHRFFEFKCISVNNVKSFLVWVLVDTLSTFGMLSAAHLFSLCGIVLNVVAFMRGLWHYYSNASGKDEVSEVASYPTEAFKFSLSFPGCSKK